MFEWGWNLTQLRKRGVSLKNATGNKDFFQYYSQKTCFEEKKINATVSYYVTHSKMKRGVKIWDKISSFSKNEKKNTPKDSLKL